MRYSKVTCPECHAQIEIKDAWEWEEEIVYDHSCPECDAEFKVIMTVVSEFYFDVVDEDK